MIQLTFASSGTTEASNMLRKKMRRNSGASASDQDSQNPTFLRCLPSLNLLAQLCFFFTNVGRKLFCEIFCFKNLTQLDFSATKGSAFHPINRLIPGLHLNEPKAVNGVIGQRERAGSYYWLFFAKANAHPFCGWM